ncbi:50S ribosomal protein L16 [Candidatus Gottesmanbacteria bacterium]|nr:50S ribosomal protein L16 [Candidatus Gottesmanbacteria bacterium]
MLAPKRAKYRKQFRGRMKGLSFRGSDLNFGTVGLKATTAGWVSARQIEAARKAVTHYTQKGGRSWIRIFPDKPISKKPAETRMGGGKGDTFGYVAVIRPGRVLFEMTGIAREEAYKALHLAGSKLSIRTKIIEKENQ